MNLIERYGSRQVTNYRLWITSDDGEVFQVNCDEIMEFKDDRDYPGYKIGMIQIKDWVWEDIDQECRDWRKRIRMLLVVDGIGTEKAYKIVFDEVFPQDLDDEGEGIVVYRFRCTEDRPDEPH